MMQPNIQDQTFLKLEYNTVLELLAAEAVSPAGGERARALRPSSDIRRVRALLEETEEACRLVNSGASVPLSAMEGIDAVLTLLGKGVIYAKQEMEQLSAWLQAIRQMKRYMSAKTSLVPRISSYAESMEECAALREALERSIRYGEITDEASPELGRIRRQLRTVEEQIRKRIDQAMHKHRDALQETVVSQRGGRYVLAVKRGARKQVKGTVLDESASGQTLFVEPQEVAAAQAERDAWRAEEAREETRVLAQLSALAEEHKRELEQNADAMAAFDFIFARGKLAALQQGQVVKVTEQPTIRLRAARHPLLGTKAVPLDVDLEGDMRQLIITGPNTGGKTIALKTIGLTVLMVQSGLLVPADPQSELGIFDTVFADVGDGQSLSQSLSTFSAHISAVADMLGRAGSGSLVLLDELAAGTDPAEGIALSIGILEELLERRTLVVATTHFNEIKTYASVTSGCCNARMAFDPVTLQPLYRLEMGAAGDSHAFAIASRYGLPARVLERAGKRLASGAGSGSAFSETTDLKDHKQPAPPADDVGAGTRISRRDPAPELPLLQKGDSVWVHPLASTGIVFRGPDERGEVIVQVKGNRHTFNHKRLTLQIPAAELYPEEYDMSIVFDSKATRKLRHQMQRKHVDGTSIITPDED
ncbi:endonuclease MutS2 [Paenibacillus sp. 1P07SE]|uniref:endonuclease MutS2 n=1 Tax=Paenibacillus sp. 1P07SE TaxID=3132209 RepID=UPI0039A5E332